MANRLGMIRKEFKLTQQGLADILETSATNVGYYEQGKRDISTKLLYRLTRLFKVSADYLLGFEGYGIKIIFNGSAKKEFIISADELSRLRDRNAIKYDLENMERIFDINTLLNLPLNIDLSDIMINISSLSDLEIIENIPIECKNDLDKLYSILKIKSLDKEKAHAIRGILDII